MEPKDPAEPQRLKSKSKKQPDTLFKQILEEKALEFGLKKGATELRLRQQTRSDLVLIIPEGVSVIDTLFDFFRAINIIECKSENDPLDEREFIKQVIRLFEMYVQDPNLNYTQLLNVIISASRPKKFLKFARELGFRFKPVPGRKWLLQARFGFQDVVIVICAELPVQEAYYPWLLFAPVSTKTWHDFVFELMTSGGNDELLQAAYDMRPKEAEMIFRDVEKLVAEGKLEPEEAEQIESNRVLTVQFGLEKFRKSSAQLARSLSILTPEERIVGLKPEELDQLVAGLKPEERIAGLKPEERIAGLKPGEREQLLKLLMEQNTEKDEL